MHSGVPSGLHSTYASICRKMQHVSCAACLELVQVQTQTIISQERNVSLLWMPVGHVAIASAVEGGGVVGIVVVVVVDSHIQCIVLETEETTVTQQVSHRPIKCQSRLWSQRGTKVNGSHHGDNPLV